MAGEGGEMGNPSFIKPAYGVCVCDADPPNICYEETKQLLSAAAFLLNKFPRFCEKRRFIIVFILKNI